MKIKGFIIGFIIGLLIMTPIIKLKKENDQLINKNNQLIEENNYLKWQIGEVPTVIESYKEEICK